MTIPVSSPEKTNEIFGINLQYSRAEVNEVPPQIPASEQLAQWEQEGDAEKVRQVDLAAGDVDSLVHVTRQTPDGNQGLTDIFTADQLLEMQARIEGYLGVPLDVHFETLGAPTGYPEYIGRLATYFSYADDDVTSAFGVFVDRHIVRQSPSSTGPREPNSRNYAIFANQIILDQLAEYYQADLEISLNGPQKSIAGSVISWERGVAECQFLILDYIRSQVVQTPQQTQARGESVTMSVEDIHQNLSELLVNRQRLIDQVTPINPVLAGQLELVLATLPEHTQAIFHRGRMGVPRFHKHPEAARAAIQRIETLLDQAVLLTTSAPDQAEIPILEDE